MPTLVGILSTALAACGSDTTGPAPLPANQLYWKMQLKSRAITMALTPPYDTVQLTAVPITPSGDTLQGVGTVSYRATDSTVTVSSTGLVTAHYITQQTAVVASLTTNGVTHVDTAFLKVTTTRAFALATLSIQPQPADLDSARVAFGQESRINHFGGNIPVYAIDSTGRNQCDVYNDCSFLIDFTSSNTEVATVDNYGDLTTSDVGKTTLHASALVYGVSRTDSLVFTVGYPIRFATNIQSGTDSTPIITGSNGQTMGVGGRLAVENFLSQAVQVIWPYQTQKIFNINLGSAQLTDTIQGGNLTFFRFDSVGTYTAHVTVLGPGGGGTTHFALIVSAGP